MTRILPFASNPLTIHPLMPYYTNHGSFDHFISNNGSIAGASILLRAPSTFKLTLDTRMDATDTTLS